MSFFGKFKAGSAQDKANSTTPVKKDPNAPAPTPLEKHLADITDPIRKDGSDKFFGFENYGSTCYCNSIVQCLYYSAPFREHVINFPSTAFLEQIRPNGSHEPPRSPRLTSTTPYPNPTSPARKVVVPGSPLPPGQKPPEENKESPEYRKKMALQAGPVLDMTSDNSNTYGMEESLFTSMRDIFEAIISNQSRYGVVSPHRFLEILRRENEMFRSAMHQDAHEFLNLLLNQVVDNVEMFAKQNPLPALPAADDSAPEDGNREDSAVAKSGNTAPAVLDTHWVHDLFEGLLTSETRCLTCETTSQRDEAFLDLSVDLEAHTSVTSCLRKFSEEEMLCERNKFHCDNCGGLQEAEKRMKIKRLPRILALHLKRFKYTEDLQRLQKLFHRVVYPFYLRLFNTTDDAEDADRLYELSSVVVHIGGGPYHGHYVSIVKTQDRGWLLFDDELVEPVDKSYVMNFFGGEPVPGVQDAKQLACAYVLFYQETTMEAMLAEQEAEARAANPAAAATSETEANNTSARNGHVLHPMMTAKTPIAEGMEHMDPLAHAHTAPLANTRAFESQNTPFNPVLPSKSKKELKAEEKERKAAEKAAEKALIEKRRIAQLHRMETFKKQEEELKQVMDISKQTAAEEATSRGDTQTKTGLGGLARFRPGSMSLKHRSSKSLFGGGKEKPPAIPARDSSSPAVGNGHFLPSLSTTTSSTEKTEKTDSSNGLGSGHDVASPRDDAPTALPQMGLSRTPTNPAGGEVKRNRFSLGRKKSAMI
ncbi:ubiquitin carboxyl-terminal hydrolase creB like protein [Zymoseptoria brevis]|uniref:Ubiquitin carboxyl-terminal hydrolase n=1 Tax=Zymoseptoria brevis TaxID=1047168 RepID=A0A0F4GSJ3_9PEZI|nr:ubiquitin carboxyl-terminal hydrolase creB like protein [Zymoseptoria brevis]